MTLAERILLSLLSAEEGRRDLVAVIITRRSGWTTTRGSHLKNPHPGDVM